MKYSALILSLSCALCGFAVADDMTLPNGKTYTNYKVSRVEPDGITLTHSSGITKLFFWELPPDIQKQYNYNPEKARTYNKQAQAQQAAAWARQQEMAKRAQQRAEYEAAHKEVMKNIKESATELVGEVSQITEDGALIRDARVPFRYKEEVVTPGYTPMNSNRRFVTKTKYISAAADYEPVFVIGGGRGFTDGAGWKATVYPAGTYKYTTVMGAGKTVKCYALTPEDALDNLLNNP